MTVIVTIKGVDVEICPHTKMPMAFCECAIGVEYSEAQIQSVIQWMEEHPEEFAVQKYEEA